MQSKVSKLFYALDLFKKPIYLTYRGQDSFTTGCGLLLSLVFATILLAIAAFDFAEFAVSPISGITVTNQSLDPEEAQLDLHQS